MRLLSASPKSRLELKDRLDAIGFPDSVVLEILNDLERDDLISDRRYAEDLVVHLTRFKLSGRRKIDFELKRHRIAPEIRERVLADLDGEMEFERASELASSRARKLEKMPAAKKKKNIYDLLIRRGFDFEVCRRVSDRMKLS
ncbi:MAG: regulatory protein RecX [Candidatus Omnitrophota bacterium]|nr:regulatory protein RecX [Candidatus Omnitrophota bacterium]